MVNFFLLPIPLAALRGKSEKKFAKVSDTFACSDIAINHKSIYLQPLN